MFKNIYSVYVVMMVAVMFVLSSPAMATDYVVVGAKHWINSQANGVENQSFTTQINIVTTSKALAERAVKALRTSGLQATAATPYNENDPSVTNGALVSAYPSQGDWRQILDVTIVQRSGTLPATVQ